MKTEQFYNKNQFIIRGDYSNTTRKHLYLFIEDFCPQFATYSKNKRKDIQNMIDNAMIGYSEALR